MGDISDGMLEQSRLAAIKHCQPAGKVFERGTDEKRGCVRAGGSWEHTGLYGLGRKRKETGRLAGDAGERDKGFCRIE